MVVPTLDWYHQNSVLRVVAIIALVMWAILATMGFAFESIQASHDAHAVALAQKAVHRDAVATEQAQISVRLSLTALDRLQSEASGECFRVNYLRWQLDRVFLNAWTRDRDAAAYLLRIPDSGTHRLAHVFHQAAANTPWLPVTDCRAATKRPRQYHPPTSIPLRQVPSSVIRKTLRHPPPLPIVVHGVSQFSTFKLGALG